jgi:hypothetical protein
VCDGESKERPNVWPAGVSYYTGWSHAGRRLDGFRGGEILPIRILMIIREFWEFIWRPLRAPASTALCEILKAGNKTLHPDSWYIEDRLIGDRLPPDDA